MLPPFQDIIEGKACPYCGCGTKLVSGEVIYPHRAADTPRPRFSDKMYFVCEKDADHYVGTYRDNITSLGRLANPELRKLKSKGHSVFDPLWRESNVFESQKAAYDWLSEKMELPLEHTHFGMFAIEQCKQAIQHCEEMDNK